MSLQHFFLDNQIICDSLECECAGNRDSATQKCGTILLELSRDDLRHATALRLHAGEHIGVIDASGIYYECEVVSFDGCELYVCVCQHGDAEFCLASEQEITLAFGLMKGSKNDDVIRACTEIGVGCFMPVLFERCVARPEKKSASKKVQRWESIAKSAAMQSGQFKLPSVATPAEFGDFCSALTEFDEVVVFWEEADLLSRYTPVQLHDLHDINDLCSSRKISKKIAVIIGPEGGITSAEIETIKKSNKNSKIVSMGRSILRAQTACVLAAGIVKYENDKL